MKRTSISFSSLFGDLLLDRDEATEREGDSRFMGGVADRERRFRSGEPDRERGEYERPFPL